MDTFASRGILKIPRVNLLVEPHEFMRSLVFDINKVCERPDVELKQSLQKVFDEFHNNVTKIVSVIM